MVPFASLSELLEWCRRAPAGTSLDASVLAELLDTTVEVGPPVLAATSEPTSQWTWREKIWIVPSETRLGVAELAEALGRPRSWIYSRTATNAEDPIPHRKADGTLIFAAGEVRTWLRDREDVVHAVVMAPPELRAV